MLYFFKKYVDASFARSALIDVGISLAEQTLRFKYIMISAINQRNNLIFSVRSAAENA